MSSDMTSDCEWTTFSLLDLLEFIVDNRGKTVPTADTGIPLIATNCIKNDNLYPVFEKIRYVSRDTYQNWFRAHLKAGDIIFVNKGTPGQVCMVPDPVSFCIAQDMVALRANEEKIYPKYLFAVLRSHQVQQQIQNMHVGTMIPHFKKGDFEKLEIPVPDRERQMFIGDCYYAISLKIELNNRINKTLEEMAQALFKRWFVDFEFPDENGQPYKSAGGEMEESELGLIPKGWKVGSIYEVTDVIFGAPFKSEIFNGEKVGMPLIRIRDLKTFNPQIFTTEINSKAEVVEAGDIVAGMDAEFRPCIWLGEKGLLNQRVCKFKQNRKSIHPFFVYATVEPHLAFYQNYKTGTTVSHLGKNDIDKIKIIVPSDKILFEFKQTIANGFDLLVLKHKERQQLIELRDALLPKLMSGEIRVPIEEVAADV